VSGPERDAGGGGDDAGGGGDDAGGGGDDAGGREDEAGGGEDEAFLGSKRFVQSRAADVRERAGPLLALSGVAKRSVSRYPHLLGEAERLLAAPTYTGEPRPTRMAAFKETLAGPLAPRRQRRAELMVGGASASSSSGARGGFAPTRALAPEELEAEGPAYLAAVREVEAEIARDGLRSRERRAEYRARIARGERIATPALAYGLRGSRGRAAVEELASRRVRPGHYGKERQRALRSREHRFATRRGMLDARRMMDECEELLGVLGEATRPTTERRNADWATRLYDVHAQETVRLGREAAGRRRRAGLPPVGSPRRRADAGPGARGHALRRRRAAAASAARRSGR
jgi:hypothetical protein